MLYNKEIYEPVESLFNTKKIRANRRIEERRNEIYTRFPQYKETEDEIASLGLELTRLALGGRDMKLDEIRSKIESLSEKRKNILRNAGLNDDYIHDVYECKKCNDTGVVDDRHCDCFMQALAEEASNRSNLAVAMKNIRMEDFNLSYYPDEADGDGRNPRTQMKCILEKVKEFIDNFGNPGNKNLLFFGNSGVGKTFLSSAIANALTAKGTTVMYYTAKELLKILTENEFSTTGEYKAACSWAKNVDLLIIDDLGSEHITAYSVASLFDIINTRGITGKAMIINTNLAPRELNGIYSERIFSRLTEFEFLKFIGKDIRAIKSGM